MRMTTWTIYDHPSDYPEHFVAREFLIVPGGARPTPSVMVSTDLEWLRTTLLVDFGMVSLARSPEDDPTIVETWF